MTAITTAALRPPPDRFPPGTVVGAYRGSAWSGTDRSVPPTGSADGSPATVLADGTLTFSGLTDQATYFGYAAGSGIFRFTTRHSAREDLVGAASVKKSRDRSRVADAYPSVMASAPTLTMSAAGAATGIASGVDYPTVVGAAAGGQFTYFGRHEVFAASYVRAKQLLGNAGATYGNLTRLEFMSDAPVFELVVRGNLAKYRLRVDGQLIGAGLRTDIPAGNGIYRLTVDFSAVGGSAVRRITVEGYDLLPSTVRCAITYGVWPSRIAGPKLVVLGDSYVLASALADADGGATAGFAFPLGQLLGCPNTVPVGIGSRGYVAPGTPGIGLPVYGDSVADVVAEAPDVVVVWGSLNDFGSNAAVQAAAATALGNLRLGLPDAVIVAVGGLNHNGSGATNINQPLTNAAIQAAAAAVGVRFVSLSGVWSGTGNVGAAAGNGNRDRYLNTDATHPTLDGYKFIANELAALIEPQLIGSVAA